MTSNCIKPETLYPTETFQYLGKEWRLFKRRAGNNASWYFQVERAGRRYLTSMKTSALKTAIASDSSPSTSSFSAAASKDSQKLIIRHPTRMFNK